ncbi:TPR-like protein [Lentinus tigrinus ALCF2SS1-6]|uniref:TPR-like protein n=1 Tax=Lentinus tigrinus ALCF2SS1-6 TaxID=1328759 RepID=A0A5C2RV05_9APHY|nr:TPR-like protein [Lentinus tigrinus ALCF2SS1-6]
MFTNLARLSRGIRLSASASCSRSLRTSAQHHLGTTTRRSQVPASVVGKRWATSTTPSSSAVNPAEVEAMQCLEEGTQKLEDGDVQAAKDLYKRSVDIKRTASGLFNLGVTHYHLKEYDDAIACWKESIALQPSSPDAHTNLASAYIVSPVSRPDLALHHLRVASSLAPEDGEIAFNLAAVLEACGHLEESLEQYQKSKDFGVDRAAMHMRNVSAKILGKKLKEAEAQQGKDEPST